MSLTEETKQKIRKKRLQRKRELGYINSPEARRKISVAQTGRKLKKAHVRHISNALKGKPKSAETRQRMSAWQIGRKLTPEHRAKLRAAHLGMKHSADARKKIGDANRGDRCRWWKGGVTPGNQLIRTSVKYRLWRTAVFERDNYTCVFCGSRNFAGKGKTTYLEADHIKPFSLYPVLRFEINNGRTLCQPCHRKTDTWGRRVFA